MTTLTSPSIKLGLTEISHLRQLLAKNISEKNHWIKDFSDREFAAEFSRIVRVKRFLQKWEGDREFRAKAFLG